jgi:hypothetical protein
MFATITHIPSLHKILSNTPGNHPAPPPTTPNIIRHETPGFAMKFGIPVVVNGQVFVAASKAVTVLRLAR